MAQKNVASIRISLMELVQTRGGLYSVRDNSSTRDTDLKMVCPSCKNSLLDQVYCCQAGCHPDADAPAAREEGWKTGEIGKDRVRVSGRGKNATLTLVPAAEIELAKATTFETGELALTVCPADQVEANTYPGGNEYCFIPDKADSTYAMLLKEAAKPERAIIGILNMRGNENLYRLVEYRGTLRVVELLRPEETAVFDVIPTAPVAAPKQAMFDQLVEALEEDFDPNDYSSAQLANLKEVISARTSGLTPAAPVPTAAAPKKGDDMDALKAALAAAQANKVKGGKKAKVS